MFSQFFVLSLRGDILIFRDFRNEHSKESSQIFFKRVKVPEKGETKELPVFHSDGVQYLHVQQNGIYFVLTSTVNVSPNLGLEMLSRIVLVVGDYCGSISEEAIRKNFLMVYELIDEMMDFGYPQETTTDILRTYVQNTVVTNPPKRAPVSILPIKNTSIASSSANRSVAGDSFDKEELFVDLFEYINITFDGNGSIVKSVIEGEVKLRSFFKGNRKIMLTMNEDLQLGKDEDSHINHNYGRSVLDYCVFHENAQFNEWAVDRTLIFSPPLGQSVLMRYSISDSTFAPPFILRPYIEECGQGQIDINIEIQADFPSTAIANKLYALIPLPKATMSASCELSRLEGQEESYEYESQRKRIVWRLKLKGGQKATIKIKLNLDNDVSGNHKREIGPISLSFDIPMYICSNVLIKGVKITGGDPQKQNEVSKWVRSMTKVGSYIQRIDCNSTKHRPF